MEAEKYCIGNAMKIARDKIKRDIITQMIYKNVFKRTYQKIYSDALKKMMVKINEKLHTK